jgi:RNA polymerase sigma-70 factor (sigma-E family)
MGGSGVVAGGTHAVERDEFTAFVAAVRPALRRTATFLTGEPHDAEDLVQDTLIAVFRRWDQLRDQSTAGGYARRAMVRIFISDRRHVRWHREVLRAPQDLPDRVAGEPSDADTTLGRILAMLPPRQRAVVVLRFFHDQSVATTAEILGCAPATVRSQSTRALRAARKVLDHHA